jgi:hypothetical protein
MSDLLECVLQIKGLRETANRVTALVHSLDADRWGRAAPDGPSAAELLGQLAELESLYGASLRLMLAASRPALPAFDAQSLLALGRYRRWDAGEALERFLVRRRDNLELLDRCSAGDLSRVGLHPIRRETTIADLVALMLASDVDRVGEIRRALAPSRQELHHGQRRDHC